MTSPVSTSTSPGMLQDGRPRLDVSVEGLEKQYLLNWKKTTPTGAERLDVLKGVSFLVRGGDRVAIVGKSGAGKSTLLHLLGALDRPTKGTVTFGGDDVFRRGGSGLAKFRNVNLGFIFQFHHLLPEFTALENVMMPAIIARKSRAEAEALAIAGLREVGLDSRVEHRPGELSGGERQRVAVARAIVLKPAIVLADEPTGNLDAKTGGAIHDLLVHLNESRGMTLIVVTHNADLARKMHRQLRLVGGTVVEEAPGTAMDVAEPEAGDPQGP